MKVLVLAHVLWILLVWFSFSFLLASPGQLTWWEPWLIGIASAGITFLPWWKDMGAA